MAHPGLSVGPLWLILVYRWSRYGSSWFIGEVGIAHPGLSVEPVSSWFIGGVGIAHPVLSVEPGWLILVYRWSRYCSSWFIGGVGIAHPGLSVESVLLILVYRWNRYCSLFNVLCVLFCLSSFCVLCPLLTGFLDYQSLIALSGLSYFYLSVITYFGNLLVLFLTPK